MMRSKGFKVGYPNVVERTEFHSGAMTGEILCVQLGTKSSDDTEISPWTQQPREEHGMTNQGR